MQPKWRKWQRAYKNRIEHYTPRTDPKQPDVAVEGIIEKWNPKKKESQVSTIHVSPMIGPAIVEEYEDYNVTHNQSSAAIKTIDAAESLRKLVALDIKFMIGCD
jgi:hypothetical protein